MEKNLCKYKIFAYFEIENSNYETKIENIPILKTST